MQAIRFDDAKAINLEVNGGDVCARIEAVKRFMAFLDNQEDVDFSSGFEQSRVTVRLRMGLADWWVIDFHIAWPNPGMNETHSSLLKLVSWTAGLENAAPGHVTELTGGQARDQAVTRLVDLTGKFAQSSNDQVHVV